MIPTPVLVVDFVMQHVAYLGVDGLPIEELWTLLGPLLRQKIDPFLQSAVWHWIVAAASDSDSQDGSLRLMVFKKDVSIPLPLSGDYQEFIDFHGPVQELYLKSSDDVQWTYLTGLAPSKRLRTQLGEFPFQLLCEIARHGAQGILAPDLSRRTGQDPRSLTPRLKKLEEMGFILKKNVYNEKSKQHTSLCIHKNFAADELALSLLDIGEDLESSRNVQKTKQAVVQAVKVAPNQLRGFSDLRLELNLDKNHSSLKFFRSIVEYLDKREYVEKLMVKEGEGQSMVYCIKYLKDLPKEYDENAEFNDFFTLLEDGETEKGMESDVIDPDEDTFKNPLLNKMYPVQNQYYQYILSLEEHGATSMDIVRTITGVSDCRPYSKILDAFTSYVIDNEKLKSLRKYDDDYTNLSIIRGYDFEGKYKFYRYFTKESFAKISNVSTGKGKSTEDNKKKNKPTRVYTIDEVALKAYTPLGRITQASLLGGKRESSSLATNEHRLYEEEPKIERRGRPKKNKDPPTEDQEMNPKSKRSKKNTSLDHIAHDILIMEDSEEPTPELTTYPQSDLDHPIKQEFTESRRPLVAKSFVNTGSLKAIKRRSALMAIIRELGGVTYTTANLCRMVDEKLGNSTITDKKTLARDVSYLISSQELDTEDISFTRSGQNVVRKLLILTKEGERPSAEKIKETKEQCMLDNGNKAGASLNRKVIEDQVTLYKTERPEKRLASLRKKSSKSKREGKPKLKKEDKEESLLSETPIKDEPSDAIPLFAKKRRTRARRKESVLASQGAKSKSRGTPRIRHRSETRKFDRMDFTTLYRAVIISKTFRRGPIDFAAITELFPNIDAIELRRKWVHIRKVIGGLPAVMRGVSVFERIVTKGIEDGFVTLADLSELDYESFLALWRDADNSVLEDIDNSNPLFEALETNKEHYEIPNTTAMIERDLFEQLEDNSMRQKELILALKSFFYDNKSNKIVPKEHDDLRSVLKATFATPEEHFSAQAVKNIFSQFKDKDIEEASTQLLKDKELSYFTLQESTTRFVLTDKFHNTLVQKVFTPKFFHQAAQFLTNLKYVVDASKGLILSQGISSGEMASLINLLVEGKAKMIRLDRTYNFSGYESRLIDKAKLSCDIVVIKGDKHDDKEENKAIAIPTGKACSHVWMDLSGNINTELWIKIMITILYQVVFRPGMRTTELYKTMETVLSVRDFGLVLKWLQEGNYIVIEQGAAFAQDLWITLLGA